MASPTEVVPGVYVSEFSLVARSLELRLLQMSPEIAVLLRAVLTERPELKEQHIYDGRDASAEMLFLLMKALLDFEQTRLELEVLIDQTETRDALLSSRYFEAMNEVMLIEPRLLATLEHALRLHDGLWGKGLLLTIEEKKAQDDLQTKRAARARSQVEKREKNLKKRRDNAVAKRAAKTDLTTAPSPTPSLHETTATDVGPTGIEPGGVVVR